MLWCVGEGDEMTLFSVREGGGTLVTTKDTGLTQSEPSRLLRVLDALRVILYPQKVIGKLAEKGSISFGGWFLAVGVC